MLSAARSIFLGRETELRSASELSLPGNANMRATRHRRRRTETVRDDPLMASVRADCFWRDFALLVGVYLYEICVWPVKEC
jgi:hypothetical protein